MPVTTPYPVVFPFDKKRQMAKAMFNTMYVYDFLELIECNLLRQWCKYVQQRKRGGGPKITIPNLMMEVRELILDVTGKDITGTTRPRGQNDIGMVAWLLTGADGFASCEDRLQGPQGCRSWYSRGAQHSADHAPPRRLVKKLYTRISEPPSTARTMVARSKRRCITYSQS
ncbi:hypothetical protein GN244_ATG08031 [Phytophthora infestans]|uniref:Uncharacterized protein n=1 Tax=Phytophthora infestans TaxID=4787 RepID=A0A833WF29_PHYIN|nr:hypothetical protein GN244_ATG08031 [Phytophthora infestans]KAF4145782.1 hypothetical protein GN958_ATG05029 [Phytophthora infestans]